MINYKQYILLEHHRIADISTLYNYYKIYDAFSFIITCHKVHKGEKQINSLFFFKALLCFGKHLYFIFYACFRV